MSSVSLLIPWRSDGSNRDTILRWTSRRWEEYLPDAEHVIAGDGDPDQPFNRGQARNRAFANSMGDILVLADADTTVPSRAAIDDAIAYVEQTGSWVLPYEVYFNLCHTDTIAILDKHPAVELPEPAKFEFRLTDSISGVMVMPRQAYEAAGGYDEGFIGWGFEDRAFALALDTMWGRCHRLPGYVLHLWHPVGPTDAFGNPAIGENQNRWLRYLRAVGNKAAMEALVG